MFESIVSYGLAMGAAYALIAVAYNVMFSTSRVFSFTAGALGMLGGVFGALFIDRLGLPGIVGLLATLACCAVVGVVTEFVAVRPVLRSLDQHLYVLSTLALCLMIQQFTAIEWSTVPQRFPQLIPVDLLGIRERFWMPVVACVLVVGGLQWLYRNSMIGRAFIAIAEDNFAARALGLPERGLRVASYALAGAIGGLAGFASGGIMLAFFANVSPFNFYGFIPVALGSIGNNRGAVVAGLALGLFQQAANFLVGGVFSSVAVFGVFIVVLLIVPQGLFGEPPARRV
jgi:branched-chain amino acid transport system permease protein